MSDLDILPFRDEHSDEVISVINAAFGFERTAEWFAWKHREGPWGPSTGVVARDAEGIVGVRLLLPWRFTGPEGTVTARRAVEAATLTRARGKGVFSRLNRYLQESAPEGPPTFFFSTPNQQSRDGYAKLGWSWLAPIPHVWKPTVPRRLRKPLLESDEAIACFPATRATSGFISSDWTPETVRWRLDPRTGHHYRTLATPEGDTGLSYRTIERARVRTLLPIFAWGRASQRRRLLGEAAYRERAIMVLDTGEPGGARVSPAAGLRRGESLLAVWPSPTLSTTEWPLEEVANWRLGFADLENVL